MTEDHLLEVYEGHSPEERKIIRYSWLRAKLRDRKVAVRFFPMDQLDAEVGTLPVEWGSAAYLRTQRRGTQHKSYEQNRVIRHHVKKKVLN